jgi:adenosylmethionine-8-amino-7-oxononanoate aminotransferase
MSASSSVFTRGHLPRPTAVSASGAWITDADGNRYLDAAGGAIASVIGHGDPTVVEAMAAQARSVDWVHASAFTTDPVERYAEAVAGLVPMDAARVFPVSGGSEAMESALKMARAYHLARGEPERSVVIARESSYHGNTRGALDVSGREPLRRPYEPWLGQTVRVPAVSEYRCPNTAHPAVCARFHADLLDEVIEKIGPKRVAVFVAEPIGGATSGAAVPPDGYWEAIGEVCTRHGLLVLADEVMTGFGRTGEWFASDHFGFRPDLLIAAKGASSGYWPLGLAIASGPIHDAIEEGGGLVHGFTWSHHPVGGAVGLAVLDRIRELRLVDRARTQGEKLLSGLRSALEGNPLVGDVRGIGLLICVEIVEDRDTKTPFPRSARMTEKILERAMENGLLLYPSTGNVDGSNGDYLLIGPPLTILDDEVDLIVDRVTAAMAMRR